MCGVIGVLGVPQAAEHIRAGLAFLQHRGQDAAGIAAMDGARISIEKGYGLADDVFDRHRTAGLPGAAGIGHVRYTTAGSARALSEVQPFYVNQPFGMTLAHNGNLVRHNDLQKELADERRHISSDSDSEVLLNILARALDELGRGKSAGGDGAGGAAEPPDLPDLLFGAVAEVHRRCRGSYAAVVLVAGKGLLAFRDPRGIRPLVVGGGKTNGWLVASESVVFRPLGFKKWDDIAPGEAVFIDRRGRLHRRQCAAAPARSPCIFEYIYLARPDSTMEGASVYEARLNMGRKLAGKIRREFGDLRFDCIVPVPDSGRIAAMELAQVLGAPYREGLVKNRYIGRTFISAGQARRRLAAQKKLNTIEAEFAGKRVLLVDDSIVRGTTGRELVALARGAGAKKVYFASAAPPVRFPHLYGIDIPTRAELLAAHRTDAEIAAYLGADKVIYQELDDLIAAVSEANPALTSFETSCFDGKYPVGDIDAAYLAALEKARAADRDNVLQGDLTLNSVQ